MITTILYALLYPIFFELDKVYAEGVNFVDVDDNNDNDKKTMTYSQQQADTKCISPCSSSAKLCIAMCT